MCGVVLNWGPRFEPITAQGKVIWPPLGQWSYSPMLAVSGGGYRLSSLRLFISVKPITNNNRWKLNWLPPQKLFNLCSKRAAAAAVVVGEKNFNLTHWAFFSYLNSIMTHSFAECFLIKIFYDKQGWGWLHRNMIKNDKNETFGKDLASKFTCFVLAYWR